MKKYFGLISAAAVLFAMAACQQEVQTTENLNETVTATISVSVPNALKTKAYGDADNLTTVNYEIWDAEFTEIVEKDVINLDDKFQGTLSLKLIRFKTYNVLFWAQGEAAKHTWTDLREINIDYTPNIENDAFTGKVLGIDATNDKNLEHEVVLKRPFAQINFATNDLGADKGVNMGDLTLKSAKVTVPGLAKKFNVIEGASAGAAEDVTFESTAIMAEPFVVNEVSYDHILVFYPLVADSEKANVNLSAEFVATCGEEEVSVSWTGKGAMNNVPIQANYRTNFYGAIFTAFGDIDVSVDDDFTSVEDPNLNIDSKTIAELYDTGTADGTYLVNGTITNVVANSSDEDKEDVTITDASGSELTLTLGKEDTEITVKSIDTYYHVGDVIKVIVEKTAEGISASEILNHVRDIAIADGKYWIVYNSKHMYPTANKSYYYGNLEEKGYKDNAFTFTAVNGGYTIQDSYGKYLYQKGTYTSFNVGATLPEDGNAVWTIKVVEGGYAISNGDYVFCYSESHNNISMSKTASDAIAVNLVDASNAAERPVLSLSKITDSVAAEATTYTLDITSNVAWTATAGEGVTLDKTSGEGNGSVVLTFAANTTAEAVAYTVTVKADGCEDKVLTLTQAAAETTEPEEIVFTSFEDFLAAEVSEEIFYTLKGTIINIKEINAQYKNATLTIADEQGTEILVYRMKASTAEDGIENLGLTVGDVLIVKGNRGEYNGTKQMTAGEYVSHEDKEAPEVDGPQTVTIAEFLAAEESTSVTYRVTGTIDNVESINSDYGNATLTIKDETGTLYVYRMKEIEGGTAIEGLGLTVGDLLVVDGCRGSYNSNPQMVNGVYVSHEDREAPTSTADVVLDLTAQGYENGTEVNTITVDDVTFEFNKGTNSNTPKFYSSGSAVRIYGGGYLTVSSENKLAKIAIKYGPSDGSNEITTDCGDFNSSEWTGSSNSVKFTVGGTSGNRRIQKIEVTYE